jgi:hypothetical protein
LYKLPQQINPFDRISSYFYIFLRQLGLDDELIRIYILFILNIIINCALCCLKNISVFKLKTLIIENKKLKKKVASFEEEQGILKKRIEELISERTRTKDRKDSVYVIPRGVLKYQ